MAVVASVAAILPWRHHGCGSKRAGIASPDHPRIWQNPPLRHGNISAQRSVTQIAASGSGRFAALDSKVGTIASDAAGEVAVFWESDYLLAARVKNKGLDVLQGAVALVKNLGFKVAEATVQLEENAMDDGVSVQLLKILVKNARDKKLDAAEKSNLATSLMDFIVRSYVPGAPSSDPGFRHKVERMYKLMDQYLKNDTFSIQKNIVDHSEYTLARSRFRFDDFEAYQATAYSVRDRLIERWNDTHSLMREKDPKRIYYLSMEFLMGRSLLNSIVNIGVKGQYADALKQLGFDLEILVEQERDAALGNGGLGRLAACFLDSLATLDYPAWGYGLRYEYGMFRQTIQDGFQLEHPDYWLNFGNPWEIQRVHTTYPVKFYGHVDEIQENNKKTYIWTPGETVEAVAYDNPIPGYGTKNTINLRLWAAKPSGELELDSFSTGDYVNAVLSKQRAETISSILYPDDRTYQGKELRLKQQVFLVSASLQDVVRRYKDFHSDFAAFPQKVAFQLNDTHPIIGVAELMRILLDEEKLDWVKSWEITTKVFSFTNHAILPEALEKWPLELLENLLPRHLQIIYRINFYFMEEMKKKFGDDLVRLSRLSIIEEGEKKNVRMANLALVSCHTVNGVSKSHFEFIKSSLFKDFHDMWPHKFQCKTNGVTQRRWMACSNPDLSQLITKWLGTEAWLKELDLLLGLRLHANDYNLQEQWMKVRRSNKSRLAAYIQIISGAKVNVDAMFDVQIKRIHEYKRQFLNVIGIIHRYDCIKNMTAEDRKKVVPRVCILGGKAPPGYENAKRIIKLIHAVGDKLNNDPDVGDLLKLIFIPDYNVSMAELVIPASDISQHLSTAGSEACGTGNMKFAMNGCLIVGTKDGSNVEIQEELGSENMFLFGPSAEDIPELRTEQKDFQPVLEFRRVVGMIRKGVFGNAEYFQPLCDTIDGAGDDYYLLGHDFPSYLEAQAAVDKAFVDKKRWAEMSILSTAGCGQFSTDRTIREYAEEIWNVEPLRHS
ncbi:glycogen phosphorylase 1 [Selaginella moellendorffii]|nr:glycogen phosphorylase 1 [Selaginella moellendorffii]|eukprot:XP_002972091.2 glycogen phosphorylase 1 [Selaginella moellendorffii]